MSIGYLDIAGRGGCRGRRAWLAASGLEDHGGDPGAGRNDGKQGLQRRETLYYMGYMGDMGFDLGHDIGDMVYGLRYGL